MEATGWLPWALLSAVFAALTAVLAKVGLEGVDPDYATFFRTCVIVIVAAVFVTLAGKWRNPATLAPRSPLPRWTI